MPKSRLDFWRPKLEGNLERDRKNEAALRALGWRVLVVWECQLSEGRITTLVRQINQLPKKKKWRRFESSALNKP